MEIFSTGLVTLVTSLELSVDIESSKSHFMLAV